MECLLHRLSAITIVLRCSKDFMNINPVLVVFVSVAFIGPFHKVVDSVQEMWLVTVVVRRFLLWLCLLCAGVVLVYITVWL